MLYSSAFLPLAQQRLWWMHLQEVQVIHAHLHLYVVLEIKVALVLKYVFLTCGNFFLANPDHELSRDLEGGTTTAGMGSHTMHLRPQPQWAHTLPLYLLLTTLLSSFGRQVKFIMYH